MCWTLLLLVLGATGAKGATGDGAADGEAPDLPLQPDRTLEFSVTEATWLSLDVSPDGEQLVIEVLGDLYQLPVEGGEAQPLLTGMAFASQPRYSPDGAHIAYLSDIDGSEELWLMELASGETRKLSTTPDRTEFASPEWSPDGRHVVVSRGSWPQRTYELWTYPVNGGVGVRITKARASANTPSSQRHNALGAVYSADGRYLYYAHKFGGFGYSQRFPLWQIARRDLETGREDVITQAQGSAIRPRLSPDGTWMVYGTRYEAQTGLRIRSLATGEDDWLAWPYQRDEQEARFTRDLLPGYAFTPDGRALIGTRDGGIVRIDLDTRQTQEIPFTVNIEKAVASRLEFSQRVGVGPVKARVLADPAVSPDGERIVFASFSAIWMHDFSSAKTVRLSPQDVAASMPAFSPDGRHVAWVGWSDGEGALYRQRARSGARARKLTQVNGYYSFPAWSPDGERIVLMRGSAQERLVRERGWGQVASSELVWLPAGGGEITAIMPARGLSRPHFDARGERIYLSNSTSPIPSRSQSGLVSVRWDGTERRDIFNATGPGIFSVENEANPEHMLMAPDGRHVLMQFAHQVYVVELVPRLRKQSIKLASSALPLARLTDVGADYITWGAGGANRAEVVWTSGDQVFRRSLDSIEYDNLAGANNSGSGDADEADEADETKEVEEVEGALTGRTDEPVLASGSEVEETPAQTSPEGDALREAHASVRATQVDIYLPRHVPEGKLALVHGTAITMQGDEVIADSVIVIENDRFVSVAPYSADAVPADATVIDISGRYVLPGFIDTHAHYFPYEQVPDTTLPEFLANLAYGVTTGMDVQPTTIDILAAQDLVDAGLMLGPRALSTGPGIFTNNDFRSVEHARAVLTRYKERYRVHNLKAYISGSRKQRQWLLMAARELGLMPTTEGALDMKLSLTHALDGFSGLEHSYPVPRLYDDVVQLTARTGIAYTPTLLVVFGGPAGENFFYTGQVTGEDPHRDPKLRRFTPYEALARRTLRRVWFHESQNIVPVTAASAHRVIRAGGQVGVGSHGQLQGLGYHWELWALAEGGFTPHEALRSATLMGAQMLGLAQDLGSLEPGKLADLVILDKDPLADVRHTTALEWVMKGGEMYEAETLNKRWPERETLPEPWWWRTDPASVLGDAAQADAAQTNATQTNAAQGGEAQP